MLFQQKKVRRRKLMIEILPCLERQFVRKYFALEYSVGVVMW